MAKQLETVWDNEPGFDPVKGEFKKLDLDRWLKEHKIVEHAKADGKQNKPSTNGALVGIPDKIIGWVNQRGSICRQNVSKWLSDLEQNLADMEDTEGLELQKQMAEEILENAKLDLDGVVRSQRGHLTAPQEEVHDAKLDYDEFRRESRLRRLPDYSGRKFALSFILFFFCLELVLNATSLMDANPFGFIGAIVQMALICAVNILIMGWCMGGLLRLIHHVSVLTKWVSMTLASIAVVLVASFNIVVGHFRDSMQAILDDPSADIFQVGSDTFIRFSEGVLTFDSFQSALLALLGFLFFCVSSWKWLDRDDRYPNYGSKHRLLIEKQRVYRNQLSIAEDELKNKFVDYQKKLEDIRHKLNTKQTRWKEYYVLGTKVVTEFRTNLGQYQHHLNELLGAYISANMDARTEPEPSWFSEKVKIDQEILVSPEFTVPEQTSLKSVADLVDQKIKELQRSFKECRHRFLDLEQAMGNSSDVSEEAA